MRFVSGRDVRKCWSSFEKVILDTHVSAFSHPSFADVKTSEDVSDSVLVVKKDT